MKLVIQVQRTHFQDYVENIFNELFKALHWSRVNYFRNPIPVVPVTLVRLNRAIKIFW